jgi:hypothetical protein
LRFCCFAVQYNVLAASTQQQIVKIALATQQQSSYNTLTYKKGNKNEQLPKHVLLHDPKHSDGNAAGLQ